MDTAIKIRLPVDADISYTSLEHAAQLLGPSAVYVLRCNPVQASAVRSAYARQGRTVEQNPLAPLLSVDYDESCPRSAWELHANGKCVWTHGC
jgi:hypothetical protein